MTETIVFPIEFCVNLTKRRVGGYGELDGQTYEVELFYALGGMNYFTGTVEGRGYYLSVRPVEIGEGWKRYTGFSGTKALVHPANRYGSNKLQEVADEWLSLDNEMVQRLLTDVIARAQ
jgi:hypothetical protein